MRRVHLAYLSIITVLAAAGLGVGWAVEAPSTPTNPVGDVATDLIAGSDQGDEAPAMAEGDRLGRTARVDPVRLPSPYRDWNVVIEDDKEHPGIERVSFDSPVLGLRETAIVWLPTGEAASNRSRPWPAVLYLHGTRGTKIHPDVDEVTRELARAGAAVPFVSPATGPASTTTSPAFHKTQHLHEFVVVAPDAGPLPWCSNCNWVDGRGELGVLADTYLHDELLPLVSALYGTRTDRAGVGVVGHSMGGGGALIQGFRHPDRFAFAGSSSGTLTTWDDPMSTAQVRWAYWNRTQGFDPAVVNEVAIRNFNLLDLAPNVVGAGTELVAVIGDACLEPETSAEGDCADNTPINDTGDFAQELYQRHGNHDLTASRLLQAGAPVTFITREGNHGIFDSTFRRHFLDRLNAVFANPAATPSRFSYRTADTDFQVWDWQVAVNRPNEEFLHLSGRTDGHDLLLGGSGVITVATPATFRPGSSHIVVVTPSGGVPVASEAIADEGGRLHVVIDLGITNDLDERDALVENGMHAIAQARVEVDP